MSAPNGEQLHPTQGAPRWYIWHNAARSDIFRGAQNAADSTGQPQEVWLQTDLLNDADVPYANTVVEFQHDPGEPVTYHQFTLIAVVKRNPTRADAGL